MEGDIEDGDFGRGGLGREEVACVASVSIWPGFGAKTGFGHARNETKREPKTVLAPFFARSLTLVPPSLLLHRTETLATQAREEETKGSLLDIDQARFVYLFRSTLSIR